MNYKIFISSVHEDSVVFKQLVNWGNQGLLGSGIFFTYETEDKRHEGDEAVRKYLKNKIEICAAVLILIGNDTHNHNWIRIEAELANGFGKRIIVARIPGTNGAPPAILKNKPIIDFTYSSIRNAIIS
jgi:hypothetical protein